MNALHVIIGILALGEFAHFEGHRRARRKIRSLEAEEKKALLPPTPRKALEDRAAIAQALRLLTLGRSSEAAAVLRKRTPLALAKRETGTTGGVA